MKVKDISPCEVAIITGKGKYTGELVMYFNFNGTIHYNAYILLTAGTYWPIEGDERDKWFLDQACEHVFNFRDLK